MELRKETTTPTARSSGESSASSVASPLMALAFLTIRTLRLTSNLGPCSGGSPLSLVRLQLNSISARLGFSLGAEMAVIARIAFMASICLSGMVEARNALANLVKHETRRASDFIILSRPKTRSRLYGIRGFSFLQVLPKGAQVGVFTPPLDLTDRTNTHSPKSPAQKRNSQQESNRNGSLGVKYGRARERPAGEGLERSVYCFNSSAQDRPSFTTRLREGGEGFG